MITFKTFLKEEVEKNTKEYFPAGKGGSDIINSKNVTMKKFTNTLKQILDKHTDAAKYSKFKLKDGWAVYPNASEAIILDEEDGNPSEILKKIIDDVEAYSRKSFGKIAVNKTKDGILITGIDTYVRETKMRKSIFPDYEKYAKPGYNVYLSHPEEITSDRKSTGEMLTYDQVHHKVFSIKITSRPGYGGTSLVVEMRISLPKTPIKKTDVVDIPNNILLFK